MPRVHNLNTYSDVSRAATGEPLLSRNGGRLYRQDRTHLAGWNFYYWQGSLSCNPLEGLVQAEGGGSNLSQGEGLRGDAEGGKKRIEPPTVYPILWSLQRGRPPGQRYHLSVQTETERSGVEAAVRK